MEALSKDEVANSPALWKLACDNNESGVKLLVTSGANTEVKGGCTYDQTTSLQMAVRLNHLGVVKILLQHGADDHVRTQYGETLLHEALSRLETWDAFMMT